MSTIKRVRMIFDDGVELHGLVTPFNIEGDIADKTQISERSWKMNDLILGMKLSDVTFVSPSNRTNSDAAPAASTSPASPSALWGTFA